MNRIIFVATGVCVISLFACNSGTDQAAKTDADTSAQVMDSSHAQMETTPVEPLPDIPAGAKVSFKNLKNGQTVKSPLTVDMVAENIHVDTIGTIKPASGHHHILIDAGDSLTAGEVVPKDSTHLHFGNAQKQAVVKLAPGKHKLTLQFADGIHRSYGGRLSSTVTVDVK